jgi:predicted DNA-binding WGR domain protein
MNPTMRRYEMSGEKFWQYELTGTEALVEWGKIGGGGKQRQHKKFANEEAAKKELAKLVAKKQAEGFAEVGAAVAAKPIAAPVAAAPVAVEVAVAKAEKRAAPSTTAAPAGAFEPRIVRKPNEDATAKDTDEVDLKGDKGKWLAEIAAHYKEPDFDKTPRIQGFSHKSAISSATPACKALAERFVATYAVGKEPKTASVDDDAAALVAGPHEPIAAYVAQRSGVVHLAKVLVATTKITCHQVGGVGGAWTYFEAKALERVHHGGDAWRLATLVNQMLRSATQKERDEVRAVIEPERSGASLGMRVLYDNAIRDSDWINADANTFLAGKKEELGYDGPEQLFALLEDEYFITRLAKRHPGSVPAEDLIRKLGVGATEAVIACHDKDPGSEWNTEVLAMIESLPAAKQIAQSLSKKRSAQVARDYFKRRPDLALAVLEPIVKNDVKLAPFAKPLLEELGGGGPAKPKAKEAAKGDVPAALARPIELRKAVTLPEWASHLPQVLLKSGAALPEDATRNLLLILHQSTAKAPHAALADAKSACDPKSLADFAWALFESWLGVGGSSKEGWAFAAAGLLGDDDCARKLAPLIRAWPGESQHARAAVGLDVLGAIGTDVALMHLHGIAQKVKFKALQEKARVKMDELAAARGLTAEELADRLVPDLGLEENGSLKLDFGSRTFTVGFDEELKPYVFDASGDRLSDLPKPNKSDDAAKAKEAAERFKTLKKDARTIASGQITRLEIAMCNQRTWKAEDFKSFIVDHPLVVHLARRLVWGHGKNTFRVAEDRTFVSADDKQVDKLPATIALLHRLDMDEGTLGAWGDHFGRYEVLQPFDQLGRALYTIEDKEKKSDALSRTKGVKVKTGKVLGLEVRGWRKGPPQDAGWVWEMNKTIGDLQLTLPLGGGLCMGWHEGTPSEQELGAVGIETKDGKKANFGMLTPVVFSELVRELELLKDA